MAFDSDLTHRWESSRLPRMTKRLQVLFEDDELRGIHRAARRHRIPTAEWVRQAPREALSAEARSSRRRKLETVRGAAGYSFPTTDIDRMLDEIATPD